MQRRKRESVSMMLKRLNTQLKTGTKATDASIHISFTWLGTHEVAEDVGSGELG
jgi:hypothetical protein